MSPQTLDALWRVFAWSVNALLTGISPTHNREQRPLEGGEQYIAGGWRAALIQIRGGWEFYANVLGLPNWASGQEMCWMCRASNTIAELAWQACDVGAAWRRTRRSHSSYMRELEERGEPTPLIFALVVGLTLGCVMVDVLHAVDLGVASHAIANVFARCIRKRAWGGRTYDQNVAALGEEVKTWYKRNKGGARIQGELTWERLKTTNGWPKLKAKAAATRHLAEFALELAKQHCQDDPRIVAIVQLLCEFYDWLAKEGVYMGEAATSRLPQVGQNLCALYGQLAREAFDRKEKMWKMTPTFHLFLHLCEWQIPDLRLNPRSYWTYADENLVGSLVEVAESCHVSTLAATSMTKWVLLFFGN